ncbi:MAG: hypothetical protein GY921_07750 [Phycisphaeraceae bacterium]|nr:hypothetical protein [Phycisphaeraceae bacterium]
MNDTEGTSEPDDTGRRAVPAEIGADLIPLDRECITTRLRRDRRRAAWPLIGLGCFLLIQIGLLAPNILTIGRRFTMDEALKSDLRTATLVTSLVWIGIITVMIVAAIRRRRRLARVIEAVEDERRSPDAICPNCGGTPFQRDACCLLFPQAWSETDLHRFWHDRVALGDQAATFQRGTPPTRLTQSLPTQITALILGRRATGSIPRRIAYIVQAIVCVFILLLARHNASEFAMLAWILLFLLAGEAIFRLGKARRNRTDPFPRCLVCDQRIDPSVSRCPECGTTAGTGTIHYTGARRERFTRAIVPSVLMLGVLALIFFAGDVVRFITERLSNDALVTLAPYDEDVFHPIWTEVIARPLDDPQSDRLFDLLVSQLESGDKIYSWHPGLLAVAGGTWPNGLDAGQIDRIHAASWQAEVDAPTTVTSGESFDVTLVGERRGEILPFGQYLHVLFDGISIDGGPFVDPDDSMIWTLVAEETDDPDTTVSRRRRFQRRVAIAEPGPHRIRLAYRLVTGPGSLVDADVDRDEFGESLPPATAAWSRRFEIEHRIDVKD